MPWDINSQWKPDTTVGSEVLEIFKQKAEDSGAIDQVNQNHQEQNMTIELYVFPPSPQAFKVMAVANHLGVDWTLRPVDLVTREQKSPEFAALNPNVRMPVLKDGDYVLWESNASGQYLASKKPGSGLLPNYERARLDVTRWQFWDLTHWNLQPSCSNM
jgi:hypothetical protein